MFEWIQSHPQVYAWLILPGLIFTARVVEVSMATIRVIFVSRGYKVLAASIGFWQAMIWLLAFGQIMKNLHNPMCYVGFAGGYALGNYVGITLVEKMALGVVLIRIMTHLNADSLIESLKNGKYGVTSVDGRGAFGPTKLIFTIVPRQSIDEVIHIIQTYNPKAFYSIEEVSRVSQGMRLPWKFPNRLFSRFVYTPADV